MKKLIELLNEYRPAEENCSYELYDKWVDIKKQTPQIWYVENTYADGSVRENQTLYFISKKGGFIKWLVENDKIDFKNQAMQYAKEDLSKFFTEWKDKDGMSDEYAMILMLLAIQDKPIDFLIEILK